MEVNISHQTRQDILTTSNLAQPNLFNDASTELIQLMKMNLVRDYWSSMFFMKFKEEASMRSGVHELEQMRGWNSLHNQYKLCGLCQNENEKMMHSLHTSACSTSLAHYQITQQLPFCFLLPSLLGFFIFLRHFISLVRWVFITVLRPTKDLKKLYGSWCLITGATDGIGKAFAYQLAEKGLNLVLISRSSDKLKSVSEEIQSHFPSVQIKTVTFDFSSDEGLIELVEEEIKGLDIGVLINNVGVTYPAARFFHEVDEKVWMNIVRVNLEGTTRVAMAVVPGMLQRKRGAIVNIGSGAAIVVPSHPLYTIYAATKAYIDQLSRSMCLEYKAYGIDVQTQVPLYVATKMVSKVASIERSSLFIPTADAYAEAAVKRIGYEARCTPFWGHSLQWCLTRLVPDPILDAWRFNIGLHRRGKLSAAR